MSIRRSDMRVELKERMRGGDGVVSLRHIAEPSTMRNARLLAEATIPPGGSIGEHDHVSETEYYIILSGTGEVVDDGRAQPVGTGDVVVTGGGASHSIRNTGTEPLVFHAFIVTY